MTASVAPFALAGGTWIFVGVIVALFFIFVFGYYTRSGSGISQTPYRRPDGPPESPSELAHDITQDVQSWQRGTEGRHQSRRVDTRAPIDAAVAEALAEWHAHRGATRQLTVPLDADDHVRGPDHAPAVVIWIDAANETCRGAYRLLSELADGGEIRLAVRQLPLADVHRLALTTAEALEAAAAQDQFLALLDRLANTPFPSTEDSLLDQAAALVPDGDRLRQDVGAGTYRDRVIDQISAATASGATAVPAVYIHDQRYDGRISRDDVRRELRARP
jgi:protein-disulfide isomerase